MNPAVSMMLKRFLPLIQEKAVPSICEILDRFVKDVKLEPGEEYACVMVAPYKDEYWAYVVTMSADDQKQRIIHNVRLSDLIELGLKSIDQLC